MTANIAEALARFQAEMPTVAKTKRADVPTKNGGKYSYTYADLADVTEAAMPVLTKHGLSFVTCPRHTEHGYELRAVLLHNSGESIEGALPINGHTPQEVGSSLTYMRRYLFGCLTGVVTDNDDDGALASAQKQDRRQRRTETAAPAQPKPPSDGPKPITRAQQGKMLALFNEAGLKDRDLRLAYASETVGRDLGSSSDLTAAEASKVIDQLLAEAGANRPSADAEWPEVAQVQS